MVIRNDFVPEPKECVTLRIIPDDVPGRTDLFECNEDGTDATNYFCNFTLCITDGDGPFEVAFVQTAFTVNEDADAVNVCVNLTQPQIDILDETVNVFVINFCSSLIPSGAQLATPDSPDFLGRYFMRPGTDYAQQTSAVNMIDDIIITQTRRIICYNQTIYDDNIVEPSEYFGLTLGVANNQFTTVFTNVKTMFDQASILIRDNDGVNVGVTVGFSATSYTTTETQGSVMINVVVKIPSSGGTTVPFSLTISIQSNTAVRNADFVAVAQQTISFRAGDVSRSLTIPITNDTLCESPDEFFSINATVASSTVPVTVDPFQARVTISDISEPECVPTLSLSSESYVVGEGDESVEICVTLNVSPNVVLDFRVIASDIGSATAGEDFVAQTVPGFIIRAPRCVDIAIIDDTIALEGNETFQVQLESALPFIPVDVSTAVVTIIDYDVFTCVTTGESEVTISCSDVPSETSFQCSFDSRPLQSCEIPLVLTRNVSPPGRHSVRILTDNGENTATYTITDTSTNVTAIVPRLKIVLSDGSPRVTENSAIVAEFTTTRPVYSITCFLRYPTGSDYKNCSNGSVMYSGLMPGRYILKIFARNRQNDFASDKMAIIV